MNAMASPVAPGGALRGEPILLFGIGGEILAIPADCVREILEVPPITQVPGAPEFMASLVNVRGAIVPLADLRIPFGMPSDVMGEDTRIIVIEEVFQGEREVIGILADRVSDVCVLDDRTIDPPPGFGMRWRPEFVSGIGRKAGSFVIIPDIREIFKECAG
jgi:purine-binding chemotaxis protein CheW